METIRQRLLNGEVLAFGYEVTVLEAFAEDGVFYHKDDELVSHGRDFEELIAYLINEVGMWIPRNSRERV